MTTAGAQTGITIAEAGVSGVGANLPPYYSLLYIIKVSGDTTDGPTGPQGATGPQGIQGEVGPQGPQGPQGGVVMPTIVSQNLGGYDLDTTHSINVSGKSLVALTITFNAYIVQATEIWANIQYGIDGLGTTYDCIPTSGINYYNWPTFSTTVYLNVNGGTNLQFRCDTSGSGWAWRRLSATVLAY
jgi:hypothetical protein